MQPRKPVRAYTGLVGRPPEPFSTPIDPTEKMGGVAASEEELRKEFGVEDRKPAPKLPDSYRQTLNLDPQDVVNFFDVVVDQREEFTQVDFLVPTSMLQHRIARLQKIIARSKEIIEGLSVHAMKIRRGKDDVLDKPTREKYKREENARVARLNVKLFRYRAALRPGNYREKIWRMVSKPVYFRDVVDGIMIEVPVPDSTKYIETEIVKVNGVETHTKTKLVEEVKHDYFDLERYQAILKLNEESLFELGETNSEMKDTWRNLAQWENEVIRVAVLYGVITPRRDLAELLGLSAILDADDDPVDEADTTEDALAIKTGGACYGGRIKSEGYRFRDGGFIRRSLSSFDKPSNGLRDDGGVFDEGNSGDSLFDLNDDADSYDSR